MIEMEAKILDAATQLAKDILDSEEYRIYQNARKQVREDGLEERVLEFRKSLFALQVQGPEAYRNGIDELKNQYEELVANLSVKRYLDSEYKICRTIQKITSILTKDIEMDLDFLS